MFHSGHGETVEYKRTVSCIASLQVVSTHDQTHEAPSRQYAGTVRSSEMAWFGLGSRDSDLYFGTVQDPHSDLTYIL